MGAKDLEVLNYINTMKIARTDQLASALAISESTVRRLLDRLEKQRKVVRFHGGASSISEMAPQAGLSQRFSSFIKSKELIARRAAEEVKDGMSIVLLGGTTVSYMCKYLKSKRITVITNSMPVLDLLKHEDNKKIILLGGVYDCEEAEVRGALTNATIQQLGADCLFTSATAFDDERGFLTSHLNSTEFYQQCFHSSKKVYMLIHSEKYNKSALSVSARLDEVDCMITDENLPPEVRRRFEIHGIDVVITKLNAI